MSWKNIKQFCGLFLGLLPALALGILLLNGMLFGSDFPRGIYGQPEVPGTDTQWINFAALNQNRVWNYEHVWQNSNMQTYMERLSSQNLQAILRKGNWDSTYTNEDSIPYFVEYYSYGNYEKLQVDWDYTNALSHLNNDYGSGYYFFTHEAGTYEVEGSLLCPAGACAAAKFATGLYLTMEVTDSVPLPLLNGEPVFDALDLGYAEHGRIFRTNLRAMINCTDTTVHDTDVVFKYDMLFSLTGDSWEHHWLFIRKEDFGGNFNFQEFAIEDTADSNYQSIRYDFYTTDKADIYVDWVEYMDKEQGYPLFSGDENLRISTLEDIGAQCTDLQNDYSNIANWAQSDTPHRATYAAHGVVNDYFDTTAALEGYWPQTPFAPDAAKRRCDHFVRVARPHVFDVYHYPYVTTGSLGDQDELDTLIAKLEWAYQTVQDTIPLAFTGQAHSFSHPTEPDLRNPHASEISAEAYIALAHGIKEITFYKYNSRFVGGEYADSGLVNTSFQHPEGTMFDEKWDAVQDVFNQLDTLGSCLLAMDRYAAYCAKGGVFQLPLQSIYFEDDDEDYIEVGQFTDASSDTFLIVVNRRTDYDRHISVFTNLSGQHVLRDLYTQEKFLSSSGDFEWIPFAAGQGRVFKMEPYIDGQKVQNITLDR